MKKRNWINSFCSLDPVLQLEVAEAIITELQDNELALNEEEDDYDRKKSKIVRDFLSTYIEKANQVEEWKEFSAVFKSFDTLSATNKKAVIDVLFKTMKSYILIDAQERLFEQCMRESHVFGKWEHRTWTTYEDAVIDHEHIPNYPVEHEQWERKCTRCGYIEKVDIEPQELIDERKEKNKQKRIKQLETELKRLKEEQ